MAEEQRYARGVYVEAFAREQARRPGGMQRIEEVRSRAYGLVDSCAATPVTEIGADDIERYLARCCAGASPASLDASRSEARAFVQFVRAASPAQLEDAAAGLATAAGSAGPRSRQAIVDELREDLERLRSLDTLAFAVAVSAPLVLTVFGGALALFGSLMHLGALSGLYFVVLAHVIEGRPGLPMSGSESLGKHFWRGLMLSLVVVLPPLVIHMRLEGSGFEGLMLWPATLLAGLLGAALLPAAALAVHANDRALAALAPYLWIRIIRRIPQDYVVLAGLYVAGLVAMVVWVAVVGLALGSLPLVGLVLRAPGTCVIVLALAVGLGGVVHRHRYDLGVG